LLAGGFTRAQETDSVIADTSGGAKIIRNIKEYAKEDGFFPRILRGIINSDENGNYYQTRRTYNYEQFKRYEGSVIRKIYIRTLDVFGSSIKDPDRKAVSWVQKAGNALHVKSMDWTVRNGLLFEEGDELNPLAVAESERLLRQSSAFYDVIITVAPVKETSDTVDVWVTTQDIWSIFITGTYEYTPELVKGSAEIKDVNFLGSGSEVGGRLLYDESYPYKLDWNAQFVINNIGAAYVTARLFKESYFDDKEYGAELNRDFVTPFIRWGGGLNYNWRQNRIVTVNDSAPAFIEYYKYSTQDAWLGYSAKPGFISGGLDERLRFNIAGRVTKTKVLQNVTADTLNYNQDNYTYLASTGFSFKRYYKDSYIFGLGRTEDIPAGYIVTFTGGYQNGDYHDRGYWGGAAGWAVYDTSMGYFYAGGNVGAYRYHGTWQNGAAQIETLYFTRLLKIHTLKMRHYLWGRYTESFESSLSPDPLDINNQHGLRGISIDEIRGRRRLSFSYENNIFYPFSILGFRFATILFADAAYIVKNDQTFDKGSLMEGFGFGIRFRNEHLIFDFVQLMFGFYPKADKYGQPSFNVFTQRRDFYHFADFQFGRPTVISVE